jgi:proteasome lid subunit RPN8/RPN11
MRALEASAAPEISGDLNHVLGGGAPGEAVCSVRGQATGSLMALDFGVTDSGESSRGPGERRPGSGTPAKAAMERFYTWEPDGKSIKVLIDFDVVDRLSQDVMRGFGAVPRRGAEVGGVLVGTVEAGEKLVVHIQDFETVPCPHKRGPSYLLTEEDEAVFRQTVERLRERSDRGLHAIGYFRSHTRDGLSLSEEDLQLFGRYFPDPSAVVLLIRPYATRVSMAGIFFEEHGQIQPEKSALEFPFRRKELGGGSPEPVAKDLEYRKVETIRSQAAAAGGFSMPAGFSPASGSGMGSSGGAGLFGQMPGLEARTPGETFEEDPAPSARFKRTWVWLPLSFIFLMLGVLAGFFFAMGGRKGALNSTSADVYRLALAVKREPGALHVTWDRSLPAIRQATGGTLWINEGTPKAKEVRLRAADLQSGSVLVRLEGEAAFRLEVSLSDGNRLSELYEVRSGQ